MIVRALVPAVTLAAAIATTAAAQAPAPTTPAPATPAPAAPAAPAATPPAATTRPQPPASAAVANVQQLGTSGVTGTVTFTRRGTQITVALDLRGLRPGAHGLHIHERGDCSAADGSSAGGHFNPTNMQHGNPASGPHHAGDLPAITADRNGRARLTTRISGVTLDQGDNAIIGRAVVVHADPDDYTTQPAGNSGARIACGVITRR
jgi:Cu-Zn family superoxide dismutase